MWGCGWGGGGRRGLELEEARKGIVGLGVCAGVGGGLRIGGDGRVGEVGGVAWSVSAHERG